MKEYAIVLDLEVDLGGDRKDPSPYNKDNNLVAIGYTYRKINGEPFWNVDNPVTVSYTHLTLPTTPYV